MSIYISGSKGFVGANLVCNFKSIGISVSSISRNDLLSNSVSRFSDAHAIIHLAGAGVSDKRWNSKYRTTILNSRLLGTTAITNAVATLKPEVFISASAIGWYGETGSRAVTENDRGGDDFLAAVC